MTGRQLHYVDNLVLASSRCNLAAYPPTPPVTSRELCRRCIPLLPLISSVKDSKSD